MTKRMAAQPGMAIRGDLPRGDLPYAPVCQLGVAETRCSLRASDFSDPDVIPLPYFPYCSRADVRGCLWPCRSAFLRSQQNLDAVLLQDAMGWPLAAATIAKSIF